MKLPTTIVLVFVPFASGYFLSYLFRSVNAIIAPQLIREVGLSAGDLGLLTSAYFFTFAAFQLPLGVLLDRYGPRRVQSALLLSAALGGLIFAYGSGKAELITGRALIGLGFSGGLMASFKAVTLWFPQERWPLVNGFFLAMGGLGAVTATKPVEIMLGVMDWRTLFLGMTLITVVASVLIFLLVPAEPPRETRLTLADQFRALGIIYRDRFFWRLAPVAITTLSTGLAVQGLWAGPWFRHVAGMDRVAVANHLFTVALCVMAGMISSGLLTDLLRRVGWSMLQVMRVLVAGFLLAQLAIIHQADPSHLWAWGLFGFLSNMAVLAYPRLAGHFPLEYAGSAHTGLNVLMMSGAFGVQFGVGAVIDLWPPTPGGGYNPDAFAAAFSMLLALQAAAFLWFLIPAGEMEDASR